MSVPDGGGFSEILKKKLERTKKISSLQCCDIEHTVHQDRNTMSRGHIYRLRTQSSNTMARAATRVINHIYIQNPGDSIPVPFMPCMNGLPLAAFLRFSCSAFSSGCGRNRRGKKMSGIAANIPQIPNKRNPNHQAPIQRGSRVVMPVSGGR